jgi:hypothetical protein
MRYLSLLLLVCSFHAAALVDCTGKITMLGLHLDNGILIVGFENGPSAAQLCSIQAGVSYNNVATEVCTALYSSLLAAKAAGKKVTIRYMDHTSCTSPDLNWKAAGKLSWSSQMQD